MKVPLTAIAMRGMARFVEEQWDFPRRLWGKGGGGHRKEVKQVEKQ